MDRIRWGVVLLAVSCKHDPVGPSHQDYEATRSPLRALPAGVSEPWASVVDELEREHTSTVYVSVWADLASTNAATAWLGTQSHAYPNATVSKVFPYHTNGTTPGAELVLRELTNAFARVVPNSVVRFEKDNDKATGPRVLVTVKVTPTSAFTSPGGHRLYAALDCSYSASTRLTSGAVKPFAGDAVASSPDTLTVTRLVFKGDTPPPLGSEPSIYEDSLVYTTMLEKCGDEAIPKLVKIMLP